MVTPTAPGDVPLQPIDRLIADLAVDVPDFPEPGVLFRDLTPVFGDGPAFARMVEELARPQGGGDPRVAATATGGAGRGPRGGVDAGADPGFDGADPGFDVVVGVEARGFLLAAAVALHTGVGVVPVRKSGKLPREVISSDYTLEYGTATLELHTDSLRPGQRVLLVDDVLATGGTLAASVALVAQLGAVVTAVSVVIELAPLGGRQRLAPHPVHALWTA